MNPVQLIPQGYDVYVFDAHMKSSNGIPNLTSFFQTIYDGAQAWYRDNFEGRINASVQIFGAPFSVASNLFNIIVRIYQVGAILGLQSAGSASFFKPMAITGFVVTVLEAFYHIYGLTFQLNFGYNFNKWQHNPQEYFSYLFHNYLGINKNDVVNIRKKIQKDQQGLTAEIEAAHIQRRATAQIRMAKMLPLARRIQPWLVQEITQTLADHPDGISQENVNEWMGLIEIQMTKKIILHCLALTTIVALGVGLALALAGAAPLVSVVLLSISPLFTAAQYLFEYGYLDSAGWEFTWINCIPNWIRRVIDTSFGLKLEFTPGERACPVDPEPQWVALRDLA